MMWRWLCRLNFHRDVTVKETPKTELNNIGDCVGRYVILELRCSRCGREGMDIR